MITYSFRLKKYQYILHGSECTGINRFFEGFYETKRFCVKKVPKEIFVGLSKDQNLNIDKPKVILFKTVDTFGT